MFSEEFVVLYTHQKTKKHKTWQDGILKTDRSGSKATLYDDQRTLLDSVYVRPEQVKCGEELESDRYLITVEEEKKDATTTKEYDHKELCKQPPSTWRSTQESCKRKRLPGYKPPQFVQVQRPARNVEEPAFKKTRPHPNSAVMQSNVCNRSVSEDFRSRPSSKDFFSVYSKSQESSLQKSTDSQQVTSGNYPQHLRQNSGCAAEAAKQRDQQVPSVERRYDRRGHTFPYEPITSLSAVGPDRTSTASRGIASMQSESAAGKRSASQILALFSSRTAARQPAVDDKLDRLLPSRLQGDEKGRCYEETRRRLDQVTSGDSIPDLSLSETGLTYRRDGEERVPARTSSKDTCGLSQTDQTFAEVTLDDESVISDKVANEQVDSLSLIFSPDSFEQNSDYQVNSSPEKQEDKEAEDLSESPVGGEKEELRLEEDTRGSFFAKCSDSSANQTEDCSQKDSSEALSPLLSSPSRNYAPVENVRATEKHMKLNRGSLYSQSKSANQPNEMLCANKKLSAHPGSLFDYGALNSRCTGQKDNRSESSPSDKYCRVPDSCFTTGDATLDSLQTGMSPEFYPATTPAVESDTGPWTALPHISTKVIPVEGRQVKSSLGHSWKGSVVSDTVKRDYPTVPTFVQRDHEPGIAVADQQAPKDVIWIDGIGSAGKEDNTPMLHGEFPTSESLFLASTKKHLGHAVWRKQSNETVSPLRQPKQQRMPFTSAPPEDNEQQRRRNSECPTATAPQAESLSRVQSQNYGWSNSRKEPICTSGQPWQAHERNFTTQSPKPSHLDEEIFCDSRWNSPPSARAGRSFDGENFSTGDALKTVVDGSARKSHAFTLDDGVTFVPSFFGPENNEFVQSHRNSSGQQSPKELPSAKGPQFRSVLSENLPREQLQSRAIAGACRRVGLRRATRGGAASVLRSIQSIQDTGSCAQRPPVGFQPPTKPEFSVRAAQGKHDMAGELFFPSASECENVVTPSRQVTIPATFESVSHYKQVFKAALREHLNIILFELAHNYHSALQKVDVSDYSAHHTGSRQNPEGPSCTHGMARLRAVKKEGPNKGRLFYSCPGTRQSQCKFFKWADEFQSKSARSDSGVRGTMERRTTKVSLSTVEGFHAFFRSHNIPFYCECRLLRKQSYGFGKYGENKWSRQSNNEAGGGKKGLYLELSRKDNSSAYSKDDIWIVSKSLSFDQHSTFIAKSVFYGPSSTGELQIAPISGYSPSNWQSGETVHALLACNAGSELTYINNIEVCVKVQNLPLLPHMLYSPTQALEPAIRRGQRSFVPPTFASSAGVQQEISRELLESVAEDMISHYSLNQDQAAAVRACAKMFGTSETVGTPSSLTLIHGVFGAGKSFLLAVVILFLVEVFRATDAANTHQAASVQRPQWRILVSSTTNVAVDRILLGLLELGFEEFVRVGSVRKIAKPVLPHSVHSTGSDSQELRELQDMLKGDLTPSERSFVRKSIERQKLGANKKRLSEVRVVGVTCAACVFPCLEKLKFPVVLLDECSQMTEPASLLPMARFDCRKLVLVGDPKQLSPTIQGSVPQHEAGLEQTLFDRLMKMGYQPTMLRTQYRCHPAISAIANRLFYKNQLMNGVTEEDRAPLVDIVPTLCFYDVARGREKSGSDGSYYNEDEAKFVVFLIERLLESGVVPAQVGVITLYKSQLHKISSHLAAIKSTSHTELKAIQISTVDAFQGGEKDVIILSCVRTDHVGFIDCDRRTNVALTRAKRHLLIVGNLRMLSKNAVWGKVIEHCKGGREGICAAKNYMKKWEEKADDKRKRDGEKSYSNDAGFETETAEARAVHTEDKCGADMSELQEIPKLADVLPASGSSDPQQVPEHVFAVTADYGSEDELPTFDLFSTIEV